MDGGKNRQAQRDCPIWICIIKKQGKESWSKKERKERKGPEVKGKQGPKRESDTYGKARQEVELL